MILARRVAALAALSLASVGVVAVAAPPASAAADRSLTWSFSDYLANPKGLPVGFSKHVASDGATSTGADVVFGGGTGTGSLAAGDLHIAYEGTVTYSWHMEISFSDPEVIVEDGEGRIVADVAWALPETGSADDVVLTTFDPATATVDGDTFSATPRWEGVGAEGAASWAPELLEALPDSTDAFFHASGSSSDIRKAPASFTSAASAETVVGPAVSVRTTYADKRMLVDIDGTGFTAVTLPGDAGVYVAIAPAGQFPETDDFEDQEKVADTDWLRPAQIRDGAFSVRLDPENRYLNPTKRYSLYTWQAHLHSNPSQDTETPIDIDWSALAGPTKLATTVKAPTTKKAGSLVVNVSGASAKANGQVAVTLTKKGQKTKTVKGKLVRGKASLKLPKLAKGAWKANVAFTPWTADYKAVTKTVKVKVKKK